MATNSSTSRRLATLGKRYCNQIWTSDLTHSTRSVASSLTLRRSVHVSVYDKNVDDQLRPTTVPDDMIEPLSDKYWAPNPRTGVFGPASGDHTQAGERGFVTSPGMNGDADSVLEQKAFFRPQEDLDKPQHPWE